MVEYNRKTIKKQARGILKAHYFLMVILMLLGAILGSTSSTFENILSFDFQATFGESFTEVFKEIVTGDLSSAQELSASNYSDETTKDVTIGHVQAGRTGGIFADVVNKFSSGSFLASIASVIFNIVDSPSVAGIIFMLLALVIIGIEAVFLSEIFRVVLARVLMEIRIYKHLNFSAFTFLIRTKKWIHASIAYLRYNIFLGLWSLTIVGGIIKYYSYSMVKYILAENPTLTGKEAIDLSQRMMKGHKWELFVFDLSFILWDILYISTGFIAGIFFVIPYKQLARMEYFVYLRQLCKEQGLEGIEVLKDDCLYEQAPLELVDEAYSDVIEIINTPPVEIPQPSKFRAFLQDVFGVVLYYDKQEQDYRKSMADTVHIAAYKKIVKGEAYPVRLCPTPVHKNRHHMEHAYYMRHYSVTSLILIFFSFCFVGWLWEVAIHIVNDGRFVNRGVLHGPWLPIYGTGAIMILLVLNKFRSKPVLEFFSAILLCGVVEYLGSWGLEKMHDGQKWWDYTGYFLNINGRICAEGLLVFGIAGVAAVYFVAPLLDNSFTHIKEKNVLPICTVLVIIFVIDMIYSHFYPNTGAGITDYGTSASEIQSEQTVSASEEIHVYSKGKAF